MARFGSGKLVDALAIRDTNAANSTALTDLALVGSLMFFAVNTLNQAVSLQYQGSFDGTTYANIGSATSVSATSGTSAQTLSDPWPYVRVVATCSVAPASGSLTVHYSYRGLT